MRNESELKQRIRSLRQEAYGLTDDVAKGVLLAKAAALTWALEPSTWESREPAPKLNKPSKELFAMLRNPEAPLAIMQGFFEDHPTPVLCFMDERDGEHIIQPLYLEVTKHLMERLRDGSGKLPEPLEERDDAEST